MLLVEQKESFIEQNYSLPARLGKIEIHLADSDYVDATQAAAHGAPEVAANAMVSAVRVMLVVLICVLLVKLNGGNSAKKAGAGGSHRFQRPPNSDATNNNNEDPQFKTGARDLAGHRETSGGDDNTSERKQNSIGHNDGETPAAAALIVRRNSQPELASGGQAQQLREQRERQRRNSEVALAQLKLPPGPMGLPFLGYLPFVGKEIHLTLTSLSERFGPIYQIFLGNIRVVVLNEASLVRQAFKQPVFSGRPNTQLTRILQGYGIVNSEGALWKEQRAFLHSALRKLGAKSLMSGSNGLEAKIQKQVKEFVNDLSVHADEGKPCQVRPIVARAVSSVVGSIVMNLTYRKYEEKEKFDRLIELMQEGFRLFTVAMPLDFIPIFRFLPGVRYAYKKIQENRAETSAFFQGVADEHRRYLSETFNLDSPSAASSLHPSTTGGSEQQQQQPPPSPPPSPLAGGASALKAASPSSSSSAGATAAAAASPSQLGSNAAGSDDQATAGPAPSPVFLIGDGDRTGKQEKQNKQQQQQKQDDNLSAGAEQPAGGNRRKQQQQPQKPVELEDIVVRDLVDAYIVQQKKHETDGKENYFSDQQLVQIMSDIFSAGLETVTSTIEWSILFLILNPECQHEIQLEIDRVIGRARLPQLEDLAQMAYTEATIYEVIRRSNVIALGNAHATLADASIGGYLIPKGTQVLTNLYGMNMNPKLWQSPEKFDPTRFIVNEKAKKPDYFIPFSVGRRMCLGDLLAKMEVFLFIVGLLQRYDLSVADEDRHCPPQVKGTIGISHTPASFRVALKSRQPRVAAAAAADSAAPPCSQVNDNNCQDREQQAQAEQRNSL